MEKTKKTRSGKRVLRILGIIAGCIILLAVLLAGYVFIALSGNVENLSRVDEDGALYYCEYTGDYYHNAIAALPVKFLRKKGCSAFLTHNTAGDVLTARNYDFPHTDTEGNITGLNMVVRLSPEGKYSSVNLADAAWVAILGIPYGKGAPDSGKSAKLPLAILPWLCMDGMNEKGLTASILSLDTKEGEHAACQNEEGKDPVEITELLRYTLDCCATVEEAVELAGRYNMIGMAGWDFQLFVTDADGNSAVLDWRYDTLNVTYTNAATNFYVSSDDAGDIYNWKGELKGKFVLPAEKTYEYHYGYGHGYERFNAIAEALEAHIVTPEPYYTEMTDEEAMNILAAVSQDYDGESATSYTQYSVLYNNTQRSLDISVMRDYEKVFSFKLD